MRRKKLLSAVLCVVLAVAAQSVSSNLNSAGYVVKAESTEAAPASDLTQTAAPETAPPETAPPQTGPPQTAPPETAPPQTDPPQTNPPETAPPQTNPPETAPPQTNPPETTPPQTNPPETTPGTQGGSETSGNSGNTESSGGSEKPEKPEKPETGGTEGTQSETPGETVPAQTETATAPTEAAPAETVPTETAPAETESEEFLTETETGDESESESESETEFLSNDELIARQTIVIPPDIEMEFRFTKVDKRYAIVRNPQGAQVYEKKADGAREVGTLNYYGCCYILDDQKDGWYYVESGNVRGFVRAEDVVTDEVAARIVKIKGMDELPAARLLVARTDNAAFTYTHTTIQNVMVSPKYALASGEVNIYEQKKETARVVGEMSEDDLCYILADPDDDWVFVESGDARGFVEKADLATGRKVDRIVSETGEQNMPVADMLVEPEDNKACYYTLTSVKEASQAAKTREAMVNFAKQFLGNPYVWGGTSLTQGADCSGFVQSIYSYFGYSLPRVAENQAMYGMQIPVSSAEPGDLIFYARNGYVYHVSMYIGDGQVIHAAGRRVGIIISGIGGDAVWATRVIQD